MAEFLSTKGVSYYLEKIITEAQKHLFLISPFLQISEIFHQRLKDASNRKISVTIVYGKEELSHSEWDKLKELEHITLIYCENLHAKCYCNEKTLIITSMNMYEFSEKNNREMGILIDREKDGKLYHEAFKEIQSICSNSDNISEILEVYKRIKNQGYCIRCGTDIAMDRDRPFCNKCFRSWVQFENPFYEEQYCHR